MTETSSANVALADVGASPEASSRQDGRTAGQRRWLGLGLVILATAFWSTAGLFITMTVEGSTITPLGLAFWRVFSTFLCLFIALLVLRPRLLRVAPRDLPWLIGMGALAVGIFQVLWVMAVLMNGVSVSTVLQCNAPVFVTLMAWVLWREPLTWRKWAAIGLAFAGTFLIARPTDPNAVHITLVGLLISLASAFAYGGITLFTKKLTGRYNPWTILAYSFGFAALALLPFQFGRPLPQQITPQAWGAFIGLVLLTTIGGYTSYALGLRRLQASVASIVAMTEVPFAAFIGYVFLGERMDAVQILGALTVVSGVVLLSLGARREDAAGVDASDQPPIIPVA
jgi:drug/metabolite transporter, DME family